MPIRIVDERARFEALRPRQAIELSVGSAAAPAGCAVSWISVRRPPSYVKRDAVVAGVGAADQPPRHARARWNSNTAPSRAVEPSVHTHSARRAVVSQLVVRAAALGADIRRACGIPGVRRLVAVTIGADHRGTRSRLRRRARSLEPAPSARSPSASHPHRRRSARRASCRCAAQRDPFRDRRAARPAICRTRLPFTALTMARLLPWPRTLCPSTPAAPTVFSDVLSRPSPLPATIATMTRNSSSRKGFCPERRIDASDFDFDKAPLAPMMSFSVEARIVATFCKHPLKRDRHARGSILSINSSD